MKDHEFREAVNSLRDLAKNYGQTEQLRDQCSYWLRDLLKKVEKENNSRLLNAVESLIVSCQLLQCSEDIIDRHHAKQNLEYWSPIYKEMRRL